MSPTAVKREPIPINGQMLRWARNWRQRSLDAAAKRAGVTPDVVQRWEDGTDTPTVRQARLLADLYERPFLEFFAKEEPPARLPELLPDFRLHRDAPPRPEENRDLLQVQAWAEEQRLNALDLYELLGETPPQFPTNLKVSLDNAPSVVAVDARRQLSFPVEEQIRMRAREKSKLPDLLRAKMEAIGVLTLKRAALKQVGARGLCIVVFPLPIIVFGNESAGAQAFTLVHEFAHVLLGQSAIIGPPVQRRGPRGPRQIEQWCDQFAGDFLVPSDALAGRVQKPDRPQKTISDEQIRDAANVFGVSPHAMLIRFVQLGYVQDAFYWETKRPQFLKQEEEYKGFGRPEYYGSRYRASHGDLYTGLVMEAWAAGRITNHNAAEFMGIKNLQHLEDIRARFR